MNNTVPFDFAKDFDREDKVRQRRTRQEGKKEAAELRKVAEQFAADLSKIVRKKTGHGGVKVQPRTKKA